MTMTRILYCFFLLFPLGLSGQITSATNLKDELLALKTKSDSAGIKLMPEKLYLQFDKPHYAVGDTIWFKAYLLNNFLTPSDKSAILNIEIANDSNKVVGRYRLPVQSGTTWGSIVLDDKHFTAGTYTLRAYTNWMRNFGDDGFFYQTIPVSSTNANQLLVNVAFGYPTINNGPSVETKLHFTALAGSPFAAQPIALQVLNSGKRIYTQKLVTGADGGLDVNFSLPAKSTNLTIIAENDKKERLAVIPIPSKQPQNADIQFLPEGGQLVAGLPAHVGFKAIGEDGKGLDVSGIITDHAQKQVAAFKSLHNGMGCFELDVKEGEGYTAQVTLAGGTARQYNLAPVKSSGTILSIQNISNNASFYLTVAASKDIAASGQSFFLVGRARGIVCYAAIVNFHESNSVSKKIAKALFPTGIAHFTLMTTAYQPVNERMVFIDHSDNLNIKLTTDKPYYSKRDSVGLKLKVTDQDGNPVSGNFSMAVTDDAQVKSDSLSEETISTRMLLTADLKGYIERPAYYLSSQTPETRRALDNLLLTQGWVGYDWAQVFHPHPVIYRPELDFAVRGHVYNVFNKPVAGTSVMLFSKSPAILMDTMTDKGGKFVFDRLPRVDTPIFILKAVNKNGKSFNVGIGVDETAPPVFTKLAAPLTMPWFVNIDSTLLTFTKNAVQVNAQGDFTPGGHVLKEVTIHAKKIISDSQNLNGSGNADFVMDEKDLEAAGKKTWLQLLEENIKGFGEGSFNVSGHGPNALKQSYLNKYVTNFNPDPFLHQWYFINRQPVIVIVDGISASQIIETSTFRDLRDYLSHTAEDIKGMEVITSSKFAASYLSRYDPIDPEGGEQLLLEVAEDKRYPISIGPFDIAFIEITTRSGHGPVMDNTPGMYLYKPLPLSWPKTFYKPKYTIKDSSQNRLDLRSTIDWEPNIVTNANGEATIWFYTADKPSTYTITVEGTDLNGRLGYKRGKVNVETNKEKTR
jgi:hypothetical protein